MKGNFRALVKSYCLNGSMLGLKYCYIYPDCVTRCFWSITILLSLSAACQLGMFLYLRFLEMPTQITIENQFEHVDNMPYPAIIICSPTQITISSTERLRKTLVDGNLTFDLHDVIDQFLGFHGIFNKLDLNKLIHLQDIITQNRYSTANVLGLLPQRCEQFLKRCYFEGNLFACKELFAPVLTKNGMCCAFNSAYVFKYNKRNEIKRDFIPRMVTKSGFLNKLSVVTDSNPNDAVTGTVLYAGASLVMFTDCSDFPVSDESTIVYSNTEVFHILSASFTYCSDDVQQLPVSSRQCYFENEHPLSYFKQYRRTDCAEACRITEYEKKCQCTLPYVPGAKEHRICNLTSLDCIQKKTSKISIPNSIKRCQCLRNCVSREYHVESIVGNLDSAEHSIAEFYSGITYNDSTTVMHFYFPASVYKKNKQETVISLIDLAWKIIWACTMTPHVVVFCAVVSGPANLGGVFGLCLGCSFISLIEICFYVYIAIKNFMRKR